MKIVKIINRVIYVTCLVVAILLIYAVGFYKNEWQYYDSDKDNLLPYGLQPKVCLEVHRGFEFSMQNNSAVYFAIDYTFLDTNGKDKDFAETTPQIISYSFDDSNIIIEERYTGKEKKYIIAYLDTVNKNEGNLRWRDATSDELMHMHPTKRIALDNYNKINELKGLKADSVFAVLALFCVAVMAIISNIIIRRKVSCAEKC